MGYFIAGGVIMAFSAIGLFVYLFFFGVRKGGKDGFNNFGTRIVDMKQILEDENEQGVWKKKMCYWSVGSLGAWIELEIHEGLRVQNLEVKSSENS